VYCFAVFQHGGALSSWML